MSSRSPSWWAVALSAALTTIGAAAPVHSLPLFDVPSTLLQPDGAVIPCRISGDEYASFARDSRGFLLLRNLQTGYWTYAVRHDGQVVPSTNIAGRVEPASVGMTPGLIPDAPPATGGRDVPPPRMLGNSTAPVTGTRYNVVIFVHFAGDPEFARPFSYYDAMLNGPFGSMRHYFAESSYGKLTVRSSLYPMRQGTQVVSIQDPHPRSYYQPVNASNPDGYTDENRGLRENALVVGAITAIQDLVPPDAVLDGNGDGVVDNVCLILKGEADVGSQVLWPHASRLNLAAASLHGARVDWYNVQAETILDLLGVGALAHEFGHTLGLPDLYRYQAGGIDPVGPWDVMARPTNPPVHMGAYLKWRYLGWLTTIPTIIRDGGYAIRPLTEPQGNCFRIGLSFTPVAPSTQTESWVVEYRRKSGVFESSLPGTGLLVYRINTRMSGNAWSPPDGVYVYRPGGTPDANGSLGSAFYSAESGRTAIGYTTETSSFLSDGSPGFLNISQVGFAGETISFHVSDVKAIYQMAGMRFRVPPGNGLPGKPLDPQPQVDYYDPWGNTLPWITEPVTLKLLNALNGKLIGTSTVNAVEGVAAFTDIGVEKGQTRPYRLKAMGLTQETTDDPSFYVLPEPYTVFDIVTSLRLYAGLSPRISGQIGRYDMVASPYAYGDYRITISDVAGIARKVAGLSPSP